MTQRQIEKRALTVTVIVNAVITAAGIWVYFATSLQIMFLDGFFSFLALLSSITGVLISKFSRRTTKYYPHGLYFLEPLYAIFKSLLMLSLMAYALVSSAQIAYDYFIYGSGQVMNTTPIPAYAFSVTILCLGLWLFNRKEYQKTNCTSTMLRAEYQTNFIDGLQSAAIGIAILLLRFIPHGSFWGFLHYTGDFFISAVLVATSLKDPLISLFDSFRELTGGVTKDKRICEAVKLSTGLPASAFKVYKTGMKIKVCIPKSSIAPADLAAKKEMFHNLRQHYEYAEIKYTL